MVDLDELERLLNSEGCELLAMIDLHNAAAELIRDARLWREHISREGMK